MKRDGGWDDWGPHQRATAVRAHLTACRGDRAALAELFDLTDDGVSLILAGDLWRPEYTRSR
jgi:hypothetical protein